MAAYLLPAEVDLFELVMEVGNLVTHLTSMWGALAELNDIASVRGQTGRHDHHGRATSYKPPHSILED